MSELSSDELRRALAELERKLESQPVIEQAKGILMARFCLDAERAFALLVRWSQSHNVKLRAVSGALVDAVGDPGSLRRLIDLLDQGPRTGAVLGLGAEQLP